MMEFDGKLKVQRKLDNSFAQNYSSVDTEKKFQNNSQFFCSKFK